MLHNQFTRIRNLFSPIKSPSSFLHYGSFLSSSLVFGAPIGTIMVLTWFSVFDWITSFDRPSSLENIMIIGYGVGFTVLLSVPGIVLAHIIRFFECRKMKNNNKRRLLLTLTFGYIFIFTVVALYTLAYILVGPPPTEFID